MPFRMTLCFFDLAPRLLFPVVLLTCGLCLGCGGGQSAPKGAKPVADPAPATPGAECLARASAEHVPPAADEPSRVTVKHIVVKHAEAERAPDDITRSAEQACLRAVEALDKLKGGADFDEVVAEYSDEHGAATRGGMLGAVARDEVAPEFADAAFSLELNGVSYVVMTKFGFHIIMRTE